MGEETQQSELEQWKDHEGHQIEGAKVEDGIFTGYCQHCQRDVRIKGARGEETAADSDESKTESGGTDSQKVQ